MSLRERVKAFAPEGARRLRARNPAYAALSFDDVVAAAELLLVGIARVAEGGDPAEMDRHLRRVAPLRAEQKMSPVDITEAFTEVRGVLGTAADVEPKLSLSGRHRLFEAVDAVERRAVELIDQAR